MCGLVGVAATRRVADTTWLGLACGLMHHRGPDGGGEWWSSDGRVGLAHRRLAVVDLSSLAQQPMVSSCGSLCLVFNGEIYNFHELRERLQFKGHKFTSESDTEVVLAAYLEWGEKCLDQLHGMFAFGIFDVHHQRVFLARDRSGEKPLFYIVSDREIRFASELKALLVDGQLPRRVNLGELERYLVDGYTSADGSMLEGFSKLPAAHAMFFELTTGELKKWKYWRPPPPPTFAAPIADLTRELEAVLSNAVGTQLVADVPVGVLLSGGVDSSLITALAARSVSDLKTFTVRFPGFSANDETLHARQISNAFGTEHIEIDADEVDVEVLLALARHYDDPIIDSSIVPSYLLSKAVRRHCTVALGGDGGDELFGGYPHYDRLLRWEPWVTRTPTCLRALARGVTDRWVPVGVRGRMWLRSIADDWKNDVPSVTSIFDPVVSNQLIHRIPLESAVRSRSDDSKAYCPNDLLQRATRADFDGYLPGDILVKVDRASMMNSLEIRAPFLDVSVVEFAFSKVPSNLKATKSSRKVLLRSLAEKILPSGFDKKRKQGFSIPLGTWLQRGPWRRFFEDCLLGSSECVFDRKYLENLFRDDAAVCRNAERLFGLVMFELWRREYAVEVVR
jgi:asparagine synthase (glutamine-hydrolysing)